MAGQSPRQKESVGRVRHVFKQGTAKPPDTRRTLLTGEAADVFGQARMHKGELQQALAGV
jgi:hypothetical protein